MYEHPSYVYSRITDEQARAGRELERRRSMLEHPSQIVRRERPLVALLKRTFRRSHSAATRTAVESDNARLVECDVLAHAIHAR